MREIRNPGKSCQGLEAACVPWEWFAHEKAAGLLEAGSGARRPEAGGSLWSSEGNLPDHVVLDGGR